MQCPRSSEVDLGELYVQPVIQHQEDERLESSEDRNDIEDDDGDSEYDDPNGDEAAAVQHHQLIEQLAALPPQLEDPRMLVRRSVRKRITPGKYRDFVMNCSAAVKSSSQFSDTMRDFGESCTVVSVIADEPSTYREAVSNEDSNRWKNAMKSEFDALQENRTWDLTSLPAGRKALRSKWAYTVKTNAVAQAYQMRAQASERAVYVMVVVARTIGR